MSQEPEQVAKRTFLHKLATTWGFRSKAPRKITATKLLKLAPELGLFAAKARANYVYAEAPPPPLLDRELDGFYETADRVISDTTTMMRHDRLFAIWQALANSKSIVGASMAEIGVWRGGTSYLMARGRRQLAAADAPLIAIDTFEGHPGETIDAERDPFQRPGDFASTSRQQVEKYLSEFPMCRVVQGEVTKLLPTLTESRYFLVHVDTDIYASTAACLRYFHSRLVPGGTMIIDDFGAKTCPGVTQAVQDCLPVMSDCHVWQMRTEQCIITKLPTA